METYLVNYKNSLKQYGMREVEAENEDEARKIGEKEGETVTCVRNIKETGRPWNIL
jgi:hypothetical protein